MQAQIAVIIPTYNRAGKIAATIASVQNQTMRDWQLVIVDDGSTDDTVAVVATIADADPLHKITLVSQNNAGPAAARNLGVEITTAPNVVYLDSDDRLYPTALQDILWTLRDAHNLYGITAHNSTIALVDKAGAEIARKFDASGLNKDTTLHQIYDWEIKTTSSGLFHRKSLFDNGIRWRSGFWIEDLEFMLQLAVAFPSGFAYIPKVLVDYVQTYGADGLCSNATYADWANAFEKIYALHKDDPLMKNPAVYLDRVEKYRKLHIEARQGKIPLPQYKYFPELADKNNL